MLNAAGVAAIIAASAFFTLMGAATKIAVPQSSAFDVVFWRSAIVALVAAAVMKKNAVGYRPGRPALLLARCTFGFAGMMLFFWALGQIPLATATALIYTSPIFTVVLSARVAGETRIRGVLPLTLLAFIGGLLIVAPGRLDVELGTIAGLAAGFFAALAYLSIRNLRHSDPPSRIVFYFAAYSTLATAGFVSTEGWSPSGDLMWLFVAVGVTAAGGQLLSTLAYRLERASIVGPFSYATLLLSYFVGLLFFDEQPSIASTAGMLAILASGIGLSTLNRKTPA